MFSPGEINIICSDVARSLHFYTEILGFEILEEAESCYHLRSGAHQFLLLPVASAPGRVIPYCSVPTFSIDLMTDNIEDAYNYLKRQHVQFERHWQPDKRSFIIRDPDGLVWEVIARSE